MDYYFLNQILKAHIFETGDRILVGTLIYEVKLHGVEFILVNTKCSMDILVKSATLQDLTVQIKSLFI